MPISLDEFERLRNIKRAKCNWDLLLSLITQPMTIRKIVELTAHCTPDGKPLSRWYVLKKMYEFHQKGLVEMRSDGRQWYVVSKVRE